MEILSTVLIISIQSGIFQDSLVDFQSLKEFHTVWKINFLDSLEDFRIVLNVLGSLEDFRTVWMISKQSGRFFREYGRFPNSL